MSNETTKKTIAIIRGGKNDRFRSMKNGASAILSLAKYEDLLNIIDVTLDESNLWFEKGVPSNPHKVFSKADFYIDFTNNEKEAYHDLSKKLEVRPIFKTDNIPNMNRINIIRVLQQLGVSVPKYKVIRSKTNLLFDLKAIWSEFQTPLIIKEASHKFNEKSLLTYSFVDAYKQIIKILDKGSEVILEEHVKGKSISVAAIPNYRGEALYIPTPVENLNINPSDLNPSRKSFEERCLIGHYCEKRPLSHLDENLKKEMLELVKKVSSSLLTNDYSMVDLILSESKKNNKVVYSIKVVDVHLEPNVFEDSRFDSVLKNSGIDLGQFILDRVTKLSFND